MLVKTGFTIFALAIVGLVGMPLVLPNKWWLAAVVILYITGFLGGVIAVIGQKH